MAIEIPSRLNPHLVYVDSPSPHG